MIRTVVLHAAAAIGIAVAGTAFAQAPILIGQSAPLSGPSMEVGQDIRAGALAYFNKINAAGGVNGRKIELISLDDASRTSESEANTVTLVEKRNVIALFGYGSATLSVPALGIVERAKVPFFAPFSGADVLRQANPYVYNLRASYADELEKIVEHYSMLGMSRFAVLHYDDVVGKQNLSAVERALKAHKLSAVATAPIKRGQTDVAAQVAGILKTNPQVVIATTRFDGTAEFIKRARSQGSAAQFVSTSFAGATALAEELGDKGVGVLMSQVVPTPSRGSVQIVKEFKQAIAGVAAEKGDSFTALESFIAAKALVEGIKRAGANPTRASLLRALDSLHDYDVGGYVIRFSPENRNGSRFVTLTMLGRDLIFRE
ncbi:MAG TPA: ABC transporter substrate-binding protein [Burkholderiales bacterium]